MTQSPSADSGMQHPATPAPSVAPGRRAALVGLAGALAAPAIVQAQNRWKPERPIVLYNPFAAGGATDLHMRQLGDRVGKMLGQPVLVEVKPGAAGTLAPAMLLNAKPDGHAVACMSINSLRYPHYQQVSWNPLRDFSYITGLSGYTIGIVVRTDSPFKSIEDLIAAGKKEPEKYTYGTSGVGGTGQLLMIEVDQVTGAKFTHVPYKGGAEWMQALLSGQIHFLADAAQWAPHVDAGQCRILAMATEQRIPKYGSVPTLRERGFNTVAHSPYGLVGPRDMAPGVIQTLHEAFTEANNDPATIALLDRYIQVPWKVNPAEFRAFAEKYYVDVKPLLTRAGLAK